MRIAIAALVASLMLAASAQAQAPRRVGDWFVVTDRDRFSGAQNVIAARFVGGSALLLRCLDRKPSLVVKVPGAFADPADLVDIKFRADAGEVIDTIGEVLDADTIEILARPATIAAIRKAREVAFRFRGRKQFDQVFAMGRAKGAIAAVFKVCPAEDHGS